MTYDEFAERVRALLEPAAAGKGYNQTGADGVNELYAFVQRVNAGDGHAVGEVIYKMVRYGAKRNPEDVLKAAAWCYLILKHQGPSPDATGEP